MTQAASTWDQASTESRTHRSAGRGTLYGNIDFWNKSPGEKKSSSFTSGVMRMTMPKNVSVGRGGRELGPFSYGDAWGRYDVAYVRDTGKFRRP